MMNTLKSLRTIEWTDWLFTNATNVQNLTLAVLENAEMLLKLEEIMMKKSLSEELEVQVNSEVKSTEIYMEMSIQNINEDTAVITLNGSALEILIFEIDDIQI